MTLCSGIDSNCFIRFPAQARNGLRSEPSAPAAIARSSIGSFKPATMMIRASV